MTPKFSALTTLELESILQAFDAIDAAYDLLLQSGAVSESDDYTTVDLADAIAEEMTRRAYEDAGYKVNEMVARGEVDRYVRPDGQIGYGLPGSYDEAQS